MIFLAYGKEKIKLHLPAGASWQELKLKDVKPLKDPLLDVRRALQDPFGTPALRQLVKTGESVCLLVNDATRVARSELFLPLIVEELKVAGIKEKDIFIVFANGNHRSLEKEEMASLVGDEIASRITLFNHDCHKAEELVYFGRTSRGTPVHINKEVAAADRRILTGSIVYHFFAGFGGGRKALVPGVAGYETIKHNHSMMLDEKARLGVLEDNPVHEDQVEAARLVGADFLLNVVLNENKELLGVYAGEMERAHLEGCRLVREVYGAKINAPAPLVIASCGGHPKDINLYQSQKTLENAAQAVKEGGRIVLLACCPEGIGSSVYEEWAKKFSSLEEMGRALQEDFQLGGHKAFAVGRALQKAEVVLVSSLSPAKTKHLGFTPAASLDEALANVYKDNKSGSFAYIMPQGSLTVPFF